MTNEEKRNIYNNIQNLYNMDFTTWQEVLAMMYNLVADIEQKFEAFEQKFEIMIGKEVTEAIKKLYESGKLAEIINQEVFGDLNNKIDKIKAEILMTLTDEIGKIDKEIEVINEQLEYMTYYITPEMYGAKGDGVTDDTLAFKSAIEKGGTLYLDNKNYVITDTLTITKPIKIIGSGIQRRETNRPYLDFSKCVDEYALKIEVSGVKLEDFNIKGNRDLTTGIYTNYNSRFDFNNLGLYYCKNAISLTRAYNITMNNIVFEFNDNCIVLDGVCTSISMNGLIFYNSTNGFISMQELDYSVMNSCGFDHCDNAITLYNNYANNLLLNNCGFEDYIIGLYAMGNSNVIINGLTCVNTERTTDTFKGGGKITYIGGRADILKLPNKSDVIFISPITPTTPTDITIRDLPISVNAYTNVPIKNFNIINTINTVNNGSYFNVNKTNDSFYFILDIEAISNDGIETVKLGFYNSTLFNDNLDFIETSITDNGYKITFKKDCNIKIIGRLYNCKIN